MNMSTIREIGTELGFVLPQDIVKKLGIKVGDQYSFSLSEDGSIIISPVDDDTKVRTKVIEESKKMMERYKENSERAEKAIELQVYFN